MTTWHRTTWPHRATSYDGDLRRISDGPVALSTSETLEYLRQESGVDDAVVERAIRAVQDMLEPPSGWLGRALTTATYKLTLPGFAERIVLPAPPFDTLSSFAYLDSDGVEQTVDSALYRVVETEPAEIVLAHNESWPTDLDYTQPDAVRIEYTAGYGTNATDVPSIIRQWMLYQVAGIYDLRHPVVGGTIVTETPFVRHMLESWRVR